MCVVCMSYVVCVYICTYACCRICTHHLVSSSAVVMFCFVVLYVVLCFVVVCRGLASCLFVCVCL